MNWTNRPPEGEYSDAYRLIRVPATTPIMGIVTSADIIGTQTHFWRGRTRPHTQTHCEACEAGNEPRWHGYVSIMGTKTGEHAILELTPTTVKTIEKWIAEHGSIRGATIIASRLGKKINGRILVQLKPTIDQARELPKPIDIPKALLRLWQQTPTTEPEPKTHPQQNRIKHHSPNGKSNGTPA